MEIESIYKIKTMKKNYQSPSMKIKKLASSEGLCDTSMSVNVDEKVEGGNGGWAKRSVFSSDDDEQSSSSSSIWSK